MRGGPIPRLRLCLIGFVVAAGCTTNVFRDRQTALVRISDAGVISVGGRRTTVAGLPQALRRAGVQSETRIVIRYDGRLSPELRDSVGKTLSHNLFLKHRFISSRRVDAFGKGGPARQ